MFRVTIDGAPRQLAAPMSVLQALVESGCAPPALCHDARLAPIGACRLCLVEIAGEPLPVASCTAILADGMVITTISPALERLRRINLSLLAEHYPGPAPGRITLFDQLLARYAVSSGKQAPTKPVYSDDSHPYIGTAMERCIHCQRCIRICDDVQGQFVWSNWSRGEHAHIATTAGGSMLANGCVACGACTDTCPSGALFDRYDQPAAERWTRSTCSYCGVGCQLELGSRHNRVVAAQPADSPTNRGHLCAKGRYAFGFAAAADRVTTPLLREDGGDWRSVSWDRALDAAASGLAAIRSRYGPDAIGVLGSARATNEENYLIQKFARAVIGTNNVDCCARVCHTPSAKALKVMLGTGAATNCFDDIERAEMLLVCGCNPTVNHPVVGARIKQAARRGARLVVIDPRHTELADYAELHLAPRNGTDIALFNAMAAAMIEQGWTRPDFIAARVSGYAEFAAFIQAFSPERMAQVCGIDAADIRAAARLYATSPAAMCFHGLGLTEHHRGTETVMALINLALLAGQLGRAGCGINPLRGQNNVQGAAQMGCDPAVLVGAQSFAAAGERISAAWGVPLPATHGQDLLAMMDAARAGRLRGLWAVGYDIQHSLAETQRTAEALQKLDVVIVQDLFLNETARAFGTIFLPAASALEKDGTFMNSDRRVQRVRAAVDPPGECRPDWWIVQQLALRLGQARGFNFAGPEAIWDEVRALWPDAAGMSYGRIERETLHWPCPAPDHRGTPVLYRDRFAHGAKAQLARIDWHPDPEQCDEHYPLMLITGRDLYAFNTGTMTGRTPNLTLHTRDTLAMAVADADSLGLRDGEQVRVKSRYGSVVLPLRCVDELRPGEVFSTFHHAEPLVNQLSSPERDTLVHTPAHKRTAVRVDPVRADE